MCAEFIKTLAYIPQDIKIFFLVDNKYFIRIYFLIGNDLETSETLYSTSFCIKFKERIF